MAEALRLAHASPVTAWPQRINERQNEPEPLARALAADVAHAKAQFWETVRWCVVCATGLLAFVAVVRPRFEAPLSIAGVFVAAVTVLGIPQVSRLRTVTAAMLQEDFDVDLFGLPWNPQIGSRPLPELVHDLAGRFSGDRNSKRDWYVDVSALPQAYAVLICQRESLIWDFRQRRNWGIWIAGAATCWVAIGIVIALLQDWTVRGLFLRWLAPSVSILAAGFQETQAQLGTAREKEGVALEIESKLAASRTGEPMAEEHADLLRFARSIQDRLADSRKRTVRVPERFYRRRREAAARAAEAGSAELKERLLGVRYPTEGDPHADG